MFLQYTQAIFTVLFLCTHLLNNHCIPRPGSGNRRAFISSLYCQEPRYDANPACSKIGNNIFLKIGLEILIQQVKVFPFCGSRAEAYLTTGPPLTGTAKKTGYRPLKTSPTNLPRVMVQVSQFKSPVFHGKLRKPL